MLFAALQLHVHINIPLISVCLVRHLCTDVDAAWAASHNWIRQGKPNEYLICALWRVGSSFAEAVNEAAFRRRLSNQCSTLYSILPIRTRQINQNMTFTSKQMVKAFSLKYRLEMDSVCSASVYSASRRTQLAAPLRHVHICMLPSARLPRSSVDAALR